MAVRIKMCFGTPQPRRHNDCHTGHGMTSLGDSCPQDTEGMLGGGTMRGCLSFQGGREVRAISLRFTQGGAVPQRTGEGILVSFLWTREEGPRQSLV